VLSYAAITPARNEAQSLDSLADCLAAQTVRPAVWVIVDNGSTDTTAETAANLARRHAWIRTIAAPGPSTPVRGGPIVRAFVAGLEALGGKTPDVVVKLDADLTMGSGYFEGLLAAFSADPRLGIASGICHELVDGRWRPLYGTRSHVWGACRAYRRDCLDEVMPLEERQGWDEIDSLKAQIRGWRARTVFELPFFHHRPEGERDGSRARWADQGDTAHFMGYRPSYLVLRALFQTRHDAHALAMIWGYVRAAARRAPRLADSEARAYLREQQRLRFLPLRTREALGRPTS
jgi:biofilm PGA synthesis N-glycosyltransferase PgaC